jgi:uncharacterized membrane protein YraQ (UPF0718 family)
MDWKKEFKPLLIIIAVFLGMFFLPVGIPRFDNALFEALQLVKWYAREHVILCIIPAVFIAGAIGVFVSQASVMKYLGAKANKILAFGLLRYRNCSGCLFLYDCLIAAYTKWVRYRTSFSISIIGPAINVLAIF